MKSHWMVFVLAEWAAHACSCKSRLRSRTAKYTQTLPQYRRRFGELEPNLACILCTRKPCPVCDVVSSSFPSQPTANTSFIYLCIASLVLHMAFGREIPSAATTKSGCFAFSRRPVSPQTTLQIY